MLEEELPEQMTKIGVVVADEDVRIGHPQFGARR
jgi:hypothetical protein